MSNYLSTLVKTIKRRNSAFLGTIFATAFVTELAYDALIDWYWEHHNQGKGEVHPITTWLAKYIYDEDDSRERRLASLRYHSAQAERRLRSYHMGYVEPTLEEEIEFKKIEKEYEERVPGSFLVDMTQKLKKYFDQLNVSEGQENNGPTMSDSANK